ncbi:hypothetical protein RX792_28200, partial [Pseudomonas syringae pv. actinidiae]|nr:hypothetical protein [Pseudomonas syringae pv. actinidiae]
MTNANTANEAISFDHVQPIGVMQETQPVQPNGVMQKPQPSLPTQTGYALDTGSIANVLTELLATPAAAVAAIGHNTASASNEISAELELDAQIKGKLTITGNQAMSNSHPT